MFNLISNTLPGNTKRGIYILQNAVQVGAQPKEQLEAALRSIQNGKVLLRSSEDKENLPGEHSCLSCVIIYILLFDLTVQQQKVTIELKFNNALFPIMLFSSKYFVFFLPVPNSNAQDCVKKGSEFQKVSRTSDGTGDLQLSSIFSSG